MMLLILELSYPSQLSHRLLAKVKKSTKFNWNHWNIKAKELV